MKHLQMPLSDTEEALLELLRQVSKLQEENIQLKDLIKELKWRMEEHD